MLTRTTGTVGRGFERLSSGLRINGAKDDAAGLSISARMTAQIRGSSQAVRNALDSVSLLQTAEGALEETTNILQRMRELSVQAGNQTLNAGDRGAIQSELEELKSELNRINESTQFNSKQVFSQHRAVSTKQTYERNGLLNKFGAVKYDIDDDLQHYPAGTYSEVLSVQEAAERRSYVIDGMKRGWLQESERMIAKHYGLYGHGETIEVDFTQEDGDFADAPSGVLAFVSGDGPMRMHIDLNDFNITDEASGGDPTLYHDRIIAHEMVHVAMNSNGLRQSGADSWFNEGAAEFIHGAIDTRVITLDDSFDATSSADINYGEAYVAVAALHQDIKAQGGAGIKDLFDELKSGQSLSQAIGATTQWADGASFLAAFTVTGGLGDATLADLNALRLQGDSGGVGNLIDGNPALDAEEVVNDEFIDDAPSGGGTQLTMQIGANVGEELDISISSFNADAMDLTTLDVTDIHRVDFAIAGLDDAISYVSAQRSKLGALQNRLASTVENLNTATENLSASRSRIMDADFASETSQLSRAQIIQQASVSVLAQANAQPQLALSLLS